MSLFGQRELTHTPENLAGMSAPTGATRCALYLAASVNDWVDLAMHQGSGCEPLSGSGGSEFILCCFDDLLW